MADGAPSWLAQGNNDTPAPADAPASSALEVDGSAKTADYTPTEAEEKDLPRIILMMRLTNMAVAGYLIASSIINLIGIKAISATVLAVYSVCGGLLICCLETQLKFLRVIIAVNFGFLFNSVWRFMFYLILGSVQWSFGGVFGTSSAICMVAVAFFNTYVLCRYPAYRKIREKIAEEEDKRIEARIAKDVKRQVISQGLSQMTGGGGAK